MLCVVYRSSDYFANLICLCSITRDVILEAKVEELVQWSCDICFLSRPHIHAHKVVVCSSCEYLQALFQSGMQERYFLLYLPVL